MATVFTIENTAVITPGRNNACASRATWDEYHQQRLVEQKLMVEQLKETNSSRTRFIVLLMIPTLLHDKERI